MTRKTVLGAAAVFTAGLLAGTIYWLVHVQSPAPPPISLLGLLGMLAGEWVGTRLLRRMRTLCSRHRDHRPRDGDGDRREADSNGQRDASASRENSR